MKIKKIKVILLSVLLCLSFSLITQASSSSTIKLNYSKKTLYLYSNTKYDSRNKNQFSNLMLINTKSSPKWRSSNSSVVKVTKYGTIIAKSTGTSIVTARLNGKTYKCKVTVKKAISENNAKKKITVTSRKVNSKILKITLKNKTKEYEGYVRYLVYFYKNGKKLDSTNFQKRIYPDDSIVIYIEIPDGCTSYKLKKYEKDVYKMNVLNASKKIKNMSRYYEDVPLKKSLKIVNYRIENNYLNITINNSSKLKIDTCYIDLFISNSDKSSIENGSLHFYDLPVGVSSQKYYLGDNLYNKKIELQINQAYSSIRCK